MANEFKYTSITAFKAGSLHVESSGSMLLDSVIVFPLPTSYRASVSAKPLSFLPSNFTSFWKI